MHEVVHWQGSHELYTVHMQNNVKRLGHTLLTVRVKDIRVCTPNCRSPSWTQYPVTTGGLCATQCSVGSSHYCTHLCVFTKRYPLGEVWFWLKSYSTTSPRFASIPWWSSFVICVVPLFLGQTISQQHKVRWLFGCNYWREHWHWKIYCAGSQQVESESDCGGKLRFWCSRKI